MRHYTFPILFLFIAIPTSVVSADKHLEALEEQAYREAAAIAAPSIVRIETVGGLDVVNGLLTPSGPTTGVIVDADGWIITSSFNFASQPASILVTLPDGQHFPADVVANDYSSRLTLLKIEADGLQPIRPAAADDVQVGQWAIALGRTYDQPFPNLSVGIVSAIGRMWGRATQTDAKVSPTNYGGPLVNIEGEAIGILVPLDPQKSDETAGVEWYDSGIGFAIPMETILRVLGRLQEGEDLYPGRMGITFGEQGLTAGQPVLDRVRPTSPGYEAGLRTGDIITQVNGIPTPRVPHVRHILGSKYAGESISVTYLRDDAEQTVELTLVDKLTPYSAPMLGVLPSRAATTDEDTEGAIVRLVLPGTPAEAAGLQRRDRITAVDGSPIANASDLREVISHKHPKDAVELTILRDDQEQTLSVTLGEMTADVPDELPSDPTAASDSQPGEETLVGRWVDTLGKDEARSYWAYVPESYDPGQACGLVVWLHPTGDTMESEILKTWQPLCHQRGLIL
ncbi:MAG: PDZ domain-containing protein, partial [Planctomycetaceae bacterium]|nr:PDZ domain-containing protein [Planctomycetaceae bacterium]